MAKHVKLFIGMDMERNIYVPICHVMYREDGRTTAMNLPV